jgi:hypothetical protein
MTTSEPGPDINSLTADDCEQMFHASLRNGDTRGVDAALRLLAVRDPHRAQDLLDLTRMALTIASDPRLRPALEDIAKSAAAPEPFRWGGQERESFDYRLREVDEAIADGDFGLAAHALNMLIRHANRVLQRLRTATPDNSSEESPNRG